jgi:cyclase
MISAEGIVRNLRMLGTVLLLEGFAFAQQQDFSKVQIKVTKVAGTVYMLEGSGGNIRFRGR